MYRIRFHGRGGQGIKTAGRILDTTFFLEGFEVQHAPLYDAERRGAPLFAYVRAAHKPISERGMIRHPNLVVVADDTLLAVPAAGVLRGVTLQTVLLIDSVEPAPVWQQRLNFPGRLQALPATADVEDRAALPSRGAILCRCGRPFDWSAPPLAGARYWRGTGRCWPCRDPTPSGSGPGRL